MTNEKMTTTDLFDLKNLRQAKTINAAEITSKVRTVVPVRKPGNQEFFRVLDSAEYQLDVACFFEDEERDLYIVHGNIVENAMCEFNSEIKMFTLFTAILKNGSVIIFPAKHPSVNTTVGNSWAESRFRCVDIAKHSWIKMKSNMSIGAYEAFPALVQPAEPEKIEESFQDLIKIAFRNKIIDSMDHPVFKKVRGEFE